MVGRMTIEHSPGLPSWIDLSTPDIGASAAFLAGMFGWDSEDQGAEVGHYTMFSLRGHAVAGAGPSMGGPSNWNVYFATQDTAASAEAVVAAGGSVVAEPMDVVEAGRMACLRDPNGADFNVWEPRVHRGAQLVEEPNAWCWSELLSRDVEASIAFYSQVFGWSIHRDPNYSEWQRDGHSFAGLLEMPPMVPAEVSSFWMPYIAVEDVDAALAHAVELGGAVRVPGQSIPDGRFGVFQDMHGAGLGVLTLNTHS
jgi:uncharacterized protein